jgi:hypothetical protein
MRQAPTAFEGEIGAPVGDAIEVMPFLCRKARIEICILV